MNQENNLNEIRNKFFKLFEKFKRSSSGVAKICLERNKKGEKIRLNIYW